jgi:hypothetical protein
MRSFLIRCYPARWRARYGDEFAAILEERPLGPFDVADILLGALDAQLRLRGRTADTTHGRGFTMSLRIGGLAAIVGAPLWTGGFVVANGALGGPDLRAGALLLVAGSLALLVALAGLSAFQARVQPALSWAAFALPAVGTVGIMIAAAGIAVGRDEFTDAFYFGLMTFFLGSLLFAIATVRTGVLSRSAALLLAVAPILAIVGGGDGGSAQVLIAAALIGYTGGWVALGIQAIRLDGAAIAPRPA